MQSGYWYHDAQRQQHWQPDLNSKAKEFCGCGAVGDKVVHGADGAWLMCEDCLQKLQRMLAGGLP